MLGISSLIVEEVVLMLFSAINVMEDLHAGKAAAVFTHDGKTNLMLQLWMKTKMAEPLQE